MDRSYWEVDPSDQKEMWLRVIGLEQESPEETEEHASTIFSEIPPGRICLEIGAGVGRLLRPASRLFSHAIGIDYSTALQKLSVEYLKDCPSCKVVLGDGLLLPFQDNAFDFIYSYTCFHHMPTLEMVRSNLREVYRTLKPGGLCRIQTLLGVYEDGGYDGRVYPSVEAFWQEFDQIGFQKERTELLKSSRDRLTARIWITARKPR